MCLLFSVFLAGLGFLGLGFRVAFLFVSGLRGFRVPEFVGFRFQFMGICYVGLMFSSEVALGPGLVYKSKLNWG